MKKVFRYLLLTVGIIVVLAASLAAIVAMRGIPSYKAQKLNLKIAATPQRIERGQKLASMLCSSCHMDPNTGKLTGRFMGEAPDFGKIYSKNITRHPEHGIGKWTDGELAYLLRTGVKPDGTYLPIMAKLAHASDEDIASIIVFLKSDHQWVAADNTRQPQSSYSFLAKALTNARFIKPSNYPTQPIADPDTTNASQWGRYIAINQLECYSCHSKDFTTNDWDEPEKSEGYFGGGNKMVGADGKEITTMNLTMDEETGLGRWSEEDFIKAVKYGQVPHGQPALRNPMAPYTALTDNEAKAIFAYLKTLPKISNKVERKFE